VSINQPTDLLGEVYAQWVVEMGKYPDMSLQLLRIIFDDWQRVTAEPSDILYREEIIGGVGGLRVAPTESDPAQLLVLLHGGGFALGSSTSHRKLAGHIAKACGAQAFVVDFRRAPEDPYPAQLDDGDAVYEALLKAGHKPTDITLIGDSAGGNLAISLTNRRMQEGKAVPTQVMVMSPWLNMENTGATIESNNETDFLIAREGLQANIDLYLSGGASPTDPLVNPLYADFTGFPRLYINAGSVESLFDDSVQLEKRARAAGVDVTFSIGEGMQHVYPFLAGRHAQADAEIAAMAAWYRRGRETL